MSLSSQIISKFRNSGLNMPQKNISENFIDIATENHLKCDCDAILSDHKNQNVISSVLLNNNHNHTNDNHTDSIKFYNGSIHEFNQNNLSINLNGSNPDIHRQKSLSDNFLNFLSYFKSLSFNSSIDNDKSISSKNNQFFDNDFEPSKNYSYLDSTIYSFDHFLIPSLSNIKYDPFSSKDNKKSQFNNISTLSRKSLDENRNIASNNISYETQIPHIGFTLSPAGLLLPYHLGILSYLIEVNVINDKIPISGSSAGALAVATTGCGLSTLDALRSAKRVCQDARKNGSARRLHDLVKDELEKLIDNQSLLNLNERKGKITISYSQIFPFFKGHFVDNFYGKDDLIECILASCNIPFYFHKWPMVKCRNRLCIDGFFAVPPRNFGCAPTNARRTIAVSPFSRSVTRMKFAHEDIISPDLEEYDEIIYKYLEEKEIQRENFIRQNNGTTDLKIPYVTCDLKCSFVTGSEKSNSNVQDFNNSKFRIQVPIMFPPSEFNLIFTPKSQKLPKMRYSTRELLQATVQAPDDRVLEELYDLGRSDAYRWLILEYIRADKLSQNSKISDLNDIIRRFAVHKPGTSTVDKDQIKSTNQNHAEIDINIDGLRCHVSQINNKFYIGDDSYKLSDCGNSESCNIDGQMINESIHAVTGAFGKSKINFFTNPDDLSALLLKLFAKNDKFYHLYHHKFHFDNFVSLNAGREDLLNAA